MLLLLLLQVLQVLMLKAGMIKAVMLLVTDLTLPRLPLAWPSSSASNH